MPCPDGPEGSAAGVPAVPAASSCAPGESGVVSAGAPPPCSRPAWTIGSDGTPPGPNVIAGPPPAPADPADEVGNGKRVALGLSGDMGVTPGVAVGVAVVAVGVTGMLVTTEIGVGLGVTTGATTGVTTGVGVGVGVVIGGLCTVPPPLPP